MADKEAARAGLVKVGRDVDMGQHPAVDPGEQPRLAVVPRRPHHARHRDRRQARRDHDPQGRGAGGHPLRRPPARPARGQGRTAAAAADPRDPRDGPRRRQRRGDLRRLAAHAGPLPRPGRPRRQPADEDDPRRRRPSRLRGARRPAIPTTPTRPARRTSRTCGTTRSPAWSTPAWRNGILPYYGPFGDIKDVVACEDQFRNAYLLGCVGAWSLHPAQIEIAKRVFSPRPADVAHALRIIEAMGDGTGAMMIDGKMEDDASVKQCQVIVDLAQRARRSRSRAGRGLRVRVMSEPMTSGRGARCCTCPRPTSGRWRRPRRSPPTRSSSTSRTPSPPTPRRPPAPTPSPPPRRRASTATAS